MSPEIFLLITPYLRRVKIMGATNALPVFLHALLERAPSVERITTWNTLSSASLATLEKFIHLRCLDTGDADGSVLKTIFGFRYLSELRLCLPEFDTKLEYSNGVALPALRKLSIRGNGASIHDALGFLRGSPLTSLALLYVVGGEGSGEDNWRLRIMTVSQWSNSLQILELEELFGGDDADEAMDPSILDPVLKIANLRHFHLRAAPTIRFTDAYFWKMAKAWPKAEHIDITAFAPYVDSSEPVVTVASLEAFATHCPNLRELSLRLNTETTLEPMPPVLLAHGLERLYINSPTSGDHCVIARRLVALFPYLQDVDGDDEDADHDKYTWQDVASMVAFFRSTMEDNKRRGEKQL
ncbi:hypothetical protein LshimejAT787_1302350 [Lyophyllum shimeji]|uniref:Uncharacterized protein n=1 Tax=Lyophyllum shimeji TaxID=47721 RepID=A0A9P3PXK9_LYOSH|nr:hypothetical protein LshimejAT787_1302350 [Lyophyllum shimeji]